MGTDAAALTAWQQHIVKLQLTLLLLLLLLTVPLMPPHSLAGVRANHFKMSLRASQAFHYDVSIDRLLSEEEVAKQAARKERKGGEEGARGWGGGCCVHVCFFGGEGGERCAGQG
jgi:hypothetical protein